METNRRSCLKKAVLSSMLLGSLIASSSVFSDCNAVIAQTTPDASFQDNLDGTVTALETGLMWQKCSQGQRWNTGSDANNPADDSCDNPAIGLTWQAALDAAQSANANMALGYDDWYLPNVKELFSLVEEACFEPAISSTLFPAVEERSRYWSASLAGTIFDGVFGKTNAIGAFVVSFRFGSTANAEKDNTYAARLVRVSQ